MITYDPKKFAKWGMKLDIRMLREAVDFFGLENPIHLNTRKARQWYGSYDGLLLRPVSAREYLPSRHHCIRINLEHSNPMKAGETLWHELTHAAQRERYPDAITYVRAVKAQYRISYFDRPIEIEARAHESYNESVPLFRPAWS